jgi:hypothetical protein
VIKEIDHMKINITKETLVKEIQDEFNHSYPYLKIEFFGADTNALPKNRQSIKTDKKIREITRQANEGVVEYDDNTTVDHLEELFRDKLGLNIHIFRRSGNIWLETTMTESWTLGDQNTLGKEITISRAL